MGPKHQGLMHKAYMGWAGPYKAGAAMHTVWLLLMGVLCRKAAHNKKYGYCVGTLDGSSGARHHLPGSCMQALLLPADLWGVSQVSWRYSSSARISRPG